MKRYPALAAVLCATVLAGAGCGLPAEKSARSLDPNAAPYRVVTRDRAVPPAGSHRVALYFVRDGALVSVPRRILEEPGPANVLTALNAGPTAGEKSDGLTSALPPDADASVARVDATTVTVAVPRQTESIARNDSVLAFGQIVLSLTALQSISRVEFEQDGRRLQVPRADGSLSTEALTRVDYRDLVDPA